MTVTDEGRTGYGCKLGIRCGNSRNAWRKGCRHPGAVAAQEQWQAGKREQRALAAKWPDGQCLAVTHGSRYSVLVNGCRCQPGIDRMGEYYARRNDRKKLQRERDYALEYERRVARIQRATGGRLEADPRRPWRYGKAGVSSVTVQMMLHGFPDNPTQIERMVAVVRLEQQMVRDEATARMRPMFTSEIGKRLGCTDSTVTRARKERKRRREQRHLRRLADAQWRAAHKAHGAERRPRP